MPARTAKRRGRGRGRKANKTQSGTSGRAPTLNVTSSSQFGKLSSILGKSPIVLVFVYADWCGHCKTFKPDWRKLEMNKQRNMPMVSVRDDVLPQSPLNEMVTAEGYPTVTVVSPANNMSFNLPTREPTALTKLVKNADKLTPPSEGSMPTSGELSRNVNSVLTGVNMSNSSAQPTATSMQQPREIKLFDAAGQEGVTTRKPPTQVLPVTRDTVEPPLSESEFVEREGTEMPRRRYNQLGGVYNMLTSYQRRR
jgi:thiol-disulfide isomerase/thioredoxin